MGVRVVGLGPTPTAATATATATARATTTSVTPTAASTTHLFLICCRRNPKQHRRVSFPSSPLKPPQPHPLSFPLRVVGESKGTDLSSDPAVEKLESDLLVDEVDFGDLCNEFECISSPSVEATARQLARDILELRQGNRALGSFAIAVKYKDPVRTFTGREKYKRPLWATDAIENPVVSVQEMLMLSTSVLRIKWTVRGKAKGLAFSDLIVRVNSLFTLNQISGQVIEHEETWDVSSSSLISRGYFWFSRRFFSANESVKDALDLVKNTAGRFSVEKENQEIYPDPTGDPTKFFQRDDGFLRDVYQIAIFLTAIYVVVQYLRLTL